MTLEGELTTTGRSAAFGRKQTVCFPEEGTPKRTLLVKLANVCFRPIADLLDSWDIPAMRNLVAMFVGMFLANIMTLAGGAALALGITLVALGVPVVWLAWSGAVLALVAVAARHSLARSLRPALDRIAKEGITTVYMPLRNEGTDVWRPVEAMKIGELGYMVTENAPPEEEWAFEPGHILRCEKRQFSDGTHLVAVAKAT